MLPCRICRSVQQNWRPVLSGVLVERKPGNKAQKQLQKVLGSLPPAKKHQASAMFALIKGVTHSTVPDFGKCFQNCGQWRDLGTLELVWAMAKARGAPLERSAYASLLLASARAAAGKNGTGVIQRDRSRCLMLGKTAWSSLNSMKGPIRMSDYAAALALCAKAGDLEWAQDLWQKIKVQHLTPDSDALGSYLEAMVQADIWTTVEDELDTMREYGVQPNSSILSSLLIAAGSQRHLERVEWIWNKFLPSVGADAFNYIDKARALILCEEAALVPQLRPEMVQQGIRPVFKTFVCEIQALLLLLRDSPLRAELADGIQNAAMVAQNIRASQLVDKREVNELQMMQNLAERILHGERMAISELRVVI